MLAVPQDRVDAGTLAVCRAELRNASARLPRSSRSLAWCGSRTRGSSSLRARSRDQKLLHCRPKRTRVNRSARWKRARARFASRSPRRRRAPAPRREISAGGLARGRRSSALCGSMCSSTARIRFRHGRPRHALRGPDSRGRRARCARSQDDELTCQLPSTLLAPATDRGGAPRTGALRPYRSGCARAEVGESKGPLGVDLIASLEGRFTRHDPSHWSAEIDGREGELPVREPARESPLCIDLHRKWQGSSRASARCSDVRAGETTRVDLVLKQAHVSSGVYSHRKASRSRRERQRTLRNWRGRMPGFPGRPPVRTVPTACLTWESAGRASARACHWASAARGRGRPRRAPVRGRCATRAPSGGSPGSQREKSERSIGSC